MSISTSVVLYRPLLRVLVALVRIILDLWAAPLQCGYWGSMGFFCSAPQDFGLLGFFCARFPPREASSHRAPGFRFFFLFCFSILQSWLGVRLRLLLEFSVAFSLDS